MSKRPLLSEMQALESCIIESDDVEATFQTLVAKFSITMEDRLTMPSVGGDILEIFHSDPEEILRINYLVGWVLQRSREGRTTVLVDDMPSLTLEMLQPTSSWVSRMATSLGVS